MEPMPPRRTRKTQKKKKSKLLVKLQVNNRRVRVRTKCPNQPGNDRGAKSLRGYLLGLVAGHNDVDDHCEERDGENANISITAKRTTKPQKVVQQGESLARHHNYGKHEKNKNGVLTVRK